MDLQDAQPEPASREREACPGISPPDGTLESLEVDLLNEIGSSISRLESVYRDETSREHLDVLRTTIAAHVRAYLGYMAARREQIPPHTSVMYAESVGAPGVVLTNFHSLLDAGTLLGGQGACLMSFLGDKRSLIVFGERQTGKSTLLNALFELVSVDERLVTIDNGTDLPALRDRSFCVHLNGSKDTDVPSLFAKARRMNPSRLVLGELHAEETRELVNFLAEAPTVAGMCTLHATTIGNALETIANDLGGDVRHARELIARIRPVFAHMHRNARGLPQLVALWSVEGSSDGELLLKEVETASPLAHGLLAEV